MGQEGSEGERVWLAVVGQVKGDSVRERERVWIVEIGKNNTHGDYLGCCVKVR